MLTPEQLQNLPTRLVERYSELAEFVLRDIARRIAKTSQITETAEYQLIRARELGISEKEIAAKIAEINNVAESEIDALIRDAAAKSDEFDRAMLGDNDGAAIPLEENEQLQQMMEAEIKNTQKACVNFTGTTGFAMRDARGKVVYSGITDTMRKLMDDAHFKVINGVTDYNTAVRQACAALAESGLRTIYYESGHSDRIEVAVRRAVMTSVSQVTQAIAEENAEELEADGWEISAHVGARPSHAIYQGRQYPKKDYERIVKPLIDDYNCRHSAFPIIMGVSEPIYTEQELADMEKPVYYNGKKYTPYEAQQQMRKMERAMRKQKDRCITADAAGNKDDFTAASIKLRRQKDIYEDFCKQTGNYTDYERTFVQGYNRHLAGKTGAVTRKQRAQKATNSLTNGGNGGIIKKAKDTSDFDALTQYLDTTYGITIDDAVKQFDFAAVKSGIAGVEAVISEFPDVGNLLKTLTTTNSGVMSCTGSQIRFNPNYFKDNNNLADVCKRMSTIGYWPQNSTPESVGAHEAAHGVEWALIEANTSYADYAQKITAWEKCKEAKKIVSQACKNIKKTPYGMGKKNAELIESISRYASETRSEAMAEAFADVYANGASANPLSIEIKRLTQKQMKKYKGVT